MTWLMIGLSVWMSFEVYDSWVEYLHEIGWLKHRDPYRDSK